MNKNFNEIKKLHLIKIPFILIIVFVLVFLRLCEVRNCIL